MAETLSESPGDDERPRLEQRHKTPEVAKEIAIIEGPLPEQFRDAMNAYPDPAVLTFITRDEQGHVQQHAVELLKIGSAGKSGEWRFLAAPPGAALRPGENRRAPLRIGYVRGTYSPETRTGVLSVDPMTR